MVKGANGVPTPIWTVTVLDGRNRHGEQAALDDHGAAGQSASRVLRDVVARRPMMKSASLSMSTVLVCVSCNRLETEAPKKLGEVWASSGS